MTIGFNLAPEAAGIWRIDQDKQDDNEKQNYQQSAYAKVDIYQLGLLFRNIGLPPLIYESMIIQNPLKRATLEEIKKNINKLKQELLVLEIIKLRTSVASRGGSKRANRETEPEPEPELKLPRLVAVPSDRRRSKHP